MDEICEYLILKMVKTAKISGASPLDPTRGAYSAPPDPPAAFRLAFGSRTATAAQIQILYYPLQQTLKMNIISHQDQQMDLPKAVSIDKASFMPAISKPLIMEYGEFCKRSYKPKSHLA